MINPCPAGLQIQEHFNKEDRKTFTPPQTVQRFTPPFPQSAMVDGFAMGRVVLETVIPLSGIACDIRIISPVGLGLDELAVLAVQQSRYAPAELRGQKIVTRIYTDVLFVRPGQGFIGDEEKRTEFNLAVENLSKPQASNRDLAVRQIQKLSQKKYAPADALLGLMLLEGQNLPADPERALPLIRRANEKNDRLGIYAMGLALEKGLALPKSESEAYKFYHEAAVAGVAMAQLKMALAHTNGHVLPPDPQRAERYYRLCANQGIGACAFNLAIFLRDNGPTSRLTEALAWAMLAKELGMNQAPQLIDTLRQADAAAASRLRDTLLQPLRVNR